jgi:hypothetical protein
MPNTISIDSAFFKKLSFSAEQNWHQNSGTKRRDDIKRWNMARPLRGTNRSVRVCLKRASARWFGCAVNRSADPADWIGSRAWRIGMATAFDDAEFRWSYGHLAGGGVIEIDAAGATSGA